MHRSLHLGLSLVASSAALQLGHFISFLSFSAVLLQVFLGFPLFHFPSGVQVRATFWSSSFPFLSTCPMYCHLLIFMLSSPIGLGSFPQDLVADLIRPEHSQYPSQASVLECLEPLHVCHCHLSTLRPYISIDKHY